MRSTLDTRFMLAALAAALLAGPARADQAETKGGLTVKTDDGQFEFRLGGRFHIDAYAFPRCETETGGASADCPAASTVGGMFLRRGYITATGKLYGWKFKQEFDPAASSSAQSTWRDAWISTEVGPGELIIGQFKPFRSMEELTSSNDILMMERPYSSAASLYGGGARQFQMGIGYKLPLPIGMWATDVHNIHAIGAPPTEGIGASTRLTLLPLESERTKVHLGLVYGVDDFNQPAATATGGPGAATIAGRTGTNQVTSPTIALGTTGVGKVQSTYAVEAAGAFGPAFVQAEYANSTLEQTEPAPEQDVMSYYVQGSVFVTGETRPYRKDRATFGAPKPIGERGAWELTARYDYIENGDLSGALGKPEVTQITLGTNYYVNPNVRLMLNYSMGEAETTDTATDIKTTTGVDAIALRAQLSF